MLTPGKLIIAPISDYPLREDCFLSGLCLSQMGRELIRPLVVDQKKKKKKTQTIATQQNKTKKQPNKIINNKKEKKRKATLRVQLRSKFRNITFKM